MDSPNFFDHLNRTQAVTSGCLAQRPALFGGTSNVAVPEGNRHLLALYQKMFVGHLGRDPELSPVDRLFCLLIRPRESQKPQKRDILKPQT